MVLSQRGDGPVGRESGAGVARRARTRPGLGQGAGTQASEELLDADSRVYRTLEVRLLLR